MNIIKFDEKQTMSSVEIAKYTGKEHANVMRDIRKMLDELKIDQLSFEGIFLDSYKREQPLFALPKRETLILVSGYSTELRWRIIDRWQALETELALRIAEEAILDGDSFDSRKNRIKSRIERERKSPRKARKSLK